MTEIQSQFSSVHDAQAYEDARLATISSRQPPSMPLESRREETETETWDDAVSLEEITQASRTLASITLSGNGSATSLAVDSKLIFVGMSDGSILLLDHFGVTRGVFESIQGGQVTSVDSFQNSLVVAGYEDGRVVLWDASNPGKLLDVSAPTGVPISSVRWYRGGISCVAIDAMGVANLFKFSKTFLISSFTADRKLLLDGRTKHGFGPIFASKVLLTDTSVGLALTVSTFTLIVRLEPEPTKIVHRWESTALVSVQGQEAIDSNERIPCLAFHSSAFFGQNRYQCPILVRSLGRSIEFACLDQMLETVSTSSSTFEPVAPVVACEWISDCCVSFLDGNYQFQMLDTQSQLVVGRCDATRVQLVRWYLPSHPDIGVYDSSIRPLRWLDDVNASLYLLGVGELVKIGIQPWSLRVDRLVKSGQWLEALTLSLKYYRTVLLPLESGAADAPLKTVGLMSAIRDGSKVSDLLKSYLAFHMNSLSADVGAVCIEYAISINRLDLIFEDIFEAFMERDKSFELMSVLYPFILAGKITTNPPPVVFDSLIQYVSLNCPKESLELLFLSLKQVPFDLDGPIRLCKEKRLLTAMCRLYTDGLGDFVSPVQVILEWMNKGKNGAPYAITENDIRGYGYRLFLFLSYCFLGVEFPKGNVPLSREKADFARVTLLSFFFPTIPEVNLTSIQTTGDSGLVSSEGGSNDSSWFSLNVPLFTLLAFDLSGFLKVLEQASEFEEERDILRWMVIASTRLSGGDDVRKRRLLIEFIARHVTQVRRNVLHTYTVLGTSEPYLTGGTSSVKQEGDNLEAILSPRLAQRFFSDLIALSSIGGGESTQAAAVVDLVKDVVERFPDNPDWYLTIATSSISLTKSSSGRHILALLKRAKLKANPNEETFRAALDAYLQLDETEHGKTALDFVRQSKDRFHSPWLSTVVCSRARDLLRQGSDEAPMLLFEVSTDIPALMKEIEGDPASQYALLKPLVGAQAFGEEVTLEMIETFVGLLCEREPDQAYEWLSKNEGRYPLDAALEVCRSRNIEDATAYLLERAGKADEALDLVLRSVRSVLRRTVLDPPVRRKKLDHAATVAINLCINFSNSKHKDDMWFRVLDTFMEHLALGEANGKEGRDHGAEEMATLVERIVDAMMPHVRLERILDRVKQLDGSSNETFRPAVAGMLESFKREVSVYRVANRALSEDILAVEQRKRLSRVKGARIKASAFATSKVTFAPIVAATTQQLLQQQQRRSDRGLLLGGFEDFDAVDLCWDALGEGDVHRLAHNLLVGTKFELPLAPPLATANNTRSGRGNVAVAELIDAGL